MTEVCAEPCYIVVRRKISHNIARLRQRVGGGRIYAVLKAYGYGLGYETLATLCAREGIRCFAISDLAGAEAVCGAGIGWDELLLMRSAHSWEIPRLVQKMRESDACLSLKTLAVKGNDLAAIGVPTGKQMGNILSCLLEKVIDSELPNDNATLLNYVKENFLN